MTTLRIVIVVVIVILGVSATLAGVAGCGGGLGTDMMIGLGTNLWVWANEIVNPFLIPNGAGECVTDIKTEEPVRFINKCDGDPEGSTEDFSFQDWLPGTGAPEGGENNQSSPNSDANPETDPFEFHPTGTGSPGNLPDPDPANPARPAPVREELFDRLELERVAAEQRQRQPWWRKAGFCFWRKKRLSKSRSRSSSR